MWRLNQFGNWAALGIFTVGLIVSVPVLAISVILNKMEKDHSAPVDYGYGPNAGIKSPRPNLKLGETPTIPKSLLAKRSANTAASPNTAASANIAASANTGTSTAVVPPVAGGQIGGGFFGPAFPWPLIPLHVALLPDGRVLSYGTDEEGNQGGQIVYDIWNPALGNGTDAHLILANTTGNDIFCSAASLVGVTGRMLVVDGDLTVNGTRNYSNQNVETFTPANNTLTASGQTNYSRWYPTLVTMPNSDKLLLGGALYDPVNYYAGQPTPELFSAANSKWTPLPEITITTPTGNFAEWYYPRAFVGLDSAVYWLSQAGNIFRIGTGGSGTEQDTGSLLNPTIPDYPTAMTLDRNGNPFNVLTLRNNHVVQLVDISQNPPVVSTVSPINYVRDMGSATTLPDGGLLINGGSAVFNDLTTAVYQVELYNRFTGTWTLGASAAIPRLYHSTALLLPDGSVLTAGGGAPGPINELNAEIYYPYYLYANDGSGNPAQRPTIVSAPSTLNLNQTFTVQVGPNDTIGAINLIRVGFDTHAFNPEQRLIPVQFSQKGANVTAMLNAAPELAPPGYYMLFVLNSANVPAVAPIIAIQPTKLPDVVVSSLSYSSGTFTSTVTNQGTTATPAGILVGVGYWVDGEWVTWGGVNGPLAAGASITIATNGSPYNISNGPHTIGAWVNDVGRFAETITANNTLYENITVGPPSLPDVVVSSFSYDDATGIFTCIVENQGSAATPAGVLIGVGYSVDGTWVTWGGVNGPLAPGASVTIGTSVFNGTNGGPYIMSAGTHVMEAWVNDVNRFPELNTANNTFYETITENGL